MTRRMVKLAKLYGRLEGSELELARWLAEQRAATHLRPGWPGSLGWPWEPQA